MQEIAHSTVKCNGQISGAEENLARGLVAEYLSGARVEFVLDPLDIGIGQNREVGTFWEVLPEEAVSVFVEAVFPRYGRKACGCCRRSCGSGRETPAETERRRRSTDQSTVKALALGLPKRAWRTIAWRDGADRTLRSRFARLRGSRRASRRMATPSCEPRNGC